jgi:DNA-binding NtrC family response regulator
MIKFSVVSGRRGDSLQEVLECSSLPKLPIKILSGNNLTKFYMDKDLPAQLPQIMGNSPKIRKTLKEIKRVSPKDLAVLISGENESYREIVAKTIHYNSPRREGPFIAINLRTVPHESADAELFGCEKSEATRADEKASGKVEEADMGTLLLDEISCLDINLQEKLLNYMQSKQLRSPDQKDTRRPDARLICTTGIDLKDAVNKDLFRKDLYDMLNDVHIRIPSLQERKEDILPLAQYFLKKAVDRFDTGPKEFSKETKDFFVRYNWPGDLDELESTIKRAAVLSAGPVIGKKDLFMEDFGSCSMKEFLEEKLKRYLKEMTKLENCNLYDNVLSEVERSLIAIVLQETGGNQLKAAKTLGINRNTLRTKIKEYKIRI